MNAPFPLLTGPAAILRRESRLNRQLARLQRAVTIEEFWHGLRSLLLSRLPSHSISVYLDYHNAGRKFRVLHHQYAPGAPRPWAERRRFSPTPAYLRSHVGQKYFGLRELVPDRAQLRRTDYFRKVMAVEGWRSLYCLVFWQGGEPAAMLVLRRGASSPPFTAAEKDFLHSLYDHIDAAFIRSQNRLRLQQLTCREREVALAAVEGLSNIEIALKLGKSESTVKAQLFSIFSKLGLKRRSQLTGLLGG